jgi:DNA-binding response OmpR family regulator
MNILCVEDEVDIAMLLEDLLTAHGHELTSCHKGSDALPIIKKENFDMVFLDLNLPELSGSEIIDSLAKDDLLGKMNMVILTAKDLEQSEMQELKQKGVKEIMKKPMSVQEILDMVAKFE